MIAAAMLRDNIQLPTMRNAYTFALGAHVAMFIWNPTLLSSHVTPQGPMLMQVEFRDKMPELPKPVPQVVKKVKEPAVKKARKSGITLADRRQAPAAIRPVKRTPAKLVAKPLPRSRPSAFKMPKFVPHASDEDALAVASRHTKVALTPALRPASSTLQAPPTLKSKSRGIRASDVSFELTERGGISGAAAARVVNIPIGSERSELASVSGAPQLRDAPRGLRNTSGRHYQAPLGDGVGVLAGTARKGYVGAIQVGEPSEDEVIAAGTTRGDSRVGNGVEIGGPVGDRKIVRRLLPEYPAWAEEKGISALVKIYFTVKPDGSIRQTLRIVRSSGYAELDSLAKDALLAWRFSPTQASSSVNEAWGVITFRFTLA